MQKSGVAEPYKMGLIALILVSSAFVTSVRNLTMMAESGVHMLFFALIAAICFFIPVSLMTAELATGWPEAGGVYAWVKAAFGERWGFYSAWYLWSYSVLGVISTLYFAAATIAFMLPYDLSHHFVLIGIAIVIVWLFTLLGLSGQKLASMISGTCFLLGVFIPAVFIIGLGIYYCLSGHALQFQWPSHWQGWFPDLHHLTALVLLLGFVRAFTGIEASACHAHQVRRPRYYFPIMILVVVIATLCVNIIGASAIAMVVPRQHISLAAGLIDAFSDFLAVFHLQFLTNYIAALIAVGALGSVNAWLMGPVKSLREAAKQEDIPRFFSDQNKHGMPARLLIIQAVLISILLVIFHFLPNLNFAFWLSIALAMVVYCTMYILLLASGIRLRYKAPDVCRHYRIPLGNIGIWIVGVLGIVTLLVIIFLDFVPPMQFSFLDAGTYTIFMLMAAIILLFLPILIYHRGRLALA